MTAEQHARASTRLRRGIALAAGVVLTAGPVVALPLPTEASSPTYRFQARGMDGKMSVHFRSNTSIIVRGWLKDVCPNDDRGVYGYVSFMAEGHDATYRAPFVEDSNGCGNGKKRVGGRKGERRFDTSGPPLDNVYLIVCREDRDQDQGDPFCMTKVWDNPRRPG